MNHVASVWYDSRVLRCMSVMPLVILATLAATAVDIAYAGETRESEAPVIEEIFVIGSRLPSRSATDTPVPVDVLSAEEIDDTGARETGRAIQAAAPSFNFSSSTVSDGTDTLRPATLRGLGPDQTLVLVNGRRRHQGALIHVNSSVGRGTAGVDMNAIPVGAIERVEILRDGASALYGSDAMAGVINLQLKSNTDGRLHIDYGEYSEGDGTTPHLWWHDGWEIFDDGVFTLTLDYRDREGTNRAGIDGSRNYPWVCTAFGGDSSNTDKLIYNTDHAEAVCGRADAYADFHLDRYTGNGVFTTDEFSRERSNNYRIGDGDSTQYAAVANLEVPISEDWYLLAFATWSEREGQHGGFFRKPEQEDRSFYRQNLPTLAGEDTITNPYADGFLPLINPTAEDWSFSLGATGELDDNLSMDVSYTWGENSYDYQVTNSINASWFGVAADGTALTRTATYMYLDPSSGQLVTRNLQGPRGSVFEADSGGLGYRQSTLNMDFVYLLSPSLGLAFGMEGRREEYEVRAGEDYSWANYGGHNPDAPMAFDAANNNAPTAYRSFGGGIQVFPGFRPESAVDESRNSFSTYIELSLDQLRYQLAAAMRYESYSDFDDVLTVKLAGRYGTDVLAVRGAVSTGFRAPSLHQVYFNNVSTIFATDPVSGDLVPTQTGTFRNDSAVAKGLGIPALTEESSLNISAGLVYSPEQYPLNVTVDVYQIDIKDRVLLSNALSASDSALPQTVRDIITNAGAGRAQVFYNAGDISTFGYDLIASWDTEVMNMALDLSLSYNYTDTSIDSIAIPGSLIGVTVDQLFNRRDRDIIENWQPQSRWNLVADLSGNDWKLYTALRQVGEYNITATNGNRQTLSSSLLLDARFTYDVPNTGVKLLVGGDNLLDEVPDSVDPNISGLTSRAGPLVSTEGTTIVADNLGIFPFPRGSSPFGFNGAYYYFGLEYSY